MEFISIGPYCSSTDIIKNNGLRNSAYPFDYIFSSLEMVKHLKQIRWLLKKNI